MAQKIWDSRKSPKFVLVDKFVLFRSETRKDRAIAVAPLGYDLENIEIWFNVIFHSRIVFRGYYLVVASILTESTCGAFSKVGADER